MRRREFITILGGVAVAWLRGILAQVAAKRTPAPSSSVSGSRLDAVTLEGGDDPIPRPRSTGPTR
jgi:hypothetical protein